ncbi:hypothetical protein BCR35DRAFT_327426 [Leucosporidium creatinivorum]|uniref:Uncharacterized protein n=1 Tax=Leucosporidium creatinivorum TaxID=106004 RepID=A0A1Y2C4E1_9BASI|nr:hypothetical protein BCR35DRAFT_327426 [Leucosporidium creatinivorum]
MLLLLGELQRVLPLSSASHSQPQIADPALAEAFYTPRRGRRAAGHRPALDLPADIIALIVDQLRELHAEESDELIWNSTGASSGWKELKRLSHVNRAFASVCQPLYRAELHITEARNFPKHSKFLRLNPMRANELTKLFVRVYDFEFSLTRSTSDEGFSLPDLISLSPNLTTLSLSSDRTTSLSPYRRRRESSTFAAYTGGIELPALICQQAKKLRTLVYGAPCTMADIAAFTTELPDLRSLDITGDVDPAPPPNVFKMCSPTLRRFWAPTAVFTVGQLHRLVSSSRVSALAFTFDLDEYWEAQPAEEEKVNKNLKRLETLFARVGPQLKMLHVTSPYADSPEPAGRFRGGGGGLGGNGAANFLTTITLAMVGGPPPGMPGAPAPPPAQGGANPAAPPAPGAAPAPAPAPAGGRRGNRGGGGAPPIPPLPQFGPAPPPGGGANPPANPNPQAPPPPPGNANANGPNNIPQFHIFPFGANATTPPTPFFESIISHTPSLHHLELYGRRYSSSLISHLKLLPLEHLSLAVPVDEEKEATAEGLLEMVKEGSVESLRRLELSGRGGDWGAKERRLLKEACEVQDISYASTEAQRG